MIRSRLHLRLGGLFRAHAFLTNLRMCVVLVFGLAVVGILRGACQNANY